MSTDTTSGISLIQVPFHAGDDRHASAEGPGRLLEAGADELLAKQGVQVSVALARRDGPFRDTASAAARVNADVAALVHQALETRQLPVVLTGSCNTSLGVLAGFPHATCGAVWLDAHADFNTPESTASGFFAGMSAAIVTGHCYRSYWAQIGDNTPIAEDAIVMFGVRDVSPEAERERLRRSAINVVGWRDGKPERDVEAALDELARRVRDVYLHVDFDAFAPEVAPGIVDEPVPGGLSLEDAERIFRGTVQRFRIRAATLATYTPELDHEEKTLGVALHLLELLGDHVGRSA
jgi:arginase